MSPLPQADAPRRPATHAPRAITKRQPIAVILSLLVHGAVVLMLLLIVVPAPKPAKPPPVDVALVPGIRLKASQASRGEPAPSVKTPTKTVAVTPQADTPFRKTPLPPPPPEIKTVAAGRVDAPAQVAEVSAAELAGAATAEGGSGEGGGGGTGSGSGGGTCNMVRRIQEALRKDQLVITAARSPTASGKALRVWNGDWVQSTGEDGKGLAAVREAIIWEVAFAPAACRAQPVHGLVLISLNDGAGSTRLALGTADWRWSDLLGLRGVRR
jgi:hypothetical protein